MLEKEIKGVVFTFADDTERVLSGQELEMWEVICLMHSDYLLPGNSDYVLAEIAGGLVRGFVPKNIVKEV